MRGEFGDRGLDDAQRALGSGIAHHGSGGCPVGPATRPRLAQFQGTLAARHGEIDIGQDARVDQGAVQLAAGIVDPVALAERIEAVALPGVDLARERKRVEHAAEVVDGRVLALQATDLRVQETDIEGRVVDHELGARDEIEELRRHLGEARFPREALAREAVHRKRSLVAVAVGVEVTMEHATGQAATDDLHAADLDDAVTRGDLEARRLRVEDDLAHGAILAARRWLRSQAHRRARCPAHPSAPSPTANRCHARRRVHRGAPRGRGS